MSTSITTVGGIRRTAPQIQLAIARSRGDLEAAFRLAHDNYVRAGLALPNAIGMRLSEFHLLSTTEVMLVKESGTPISTATLILDGRFGLPAEAIYAPEIEALRGRGFRLAEVGSLADRRKSTTRFAHMFRRLSTLIAQAAAHRGCNGLIAATHPKHARYYIRKLGFEQFGEFRECPYVQGKPAVGLLLDFEKQRGTEVDQHLFGTPFPAEELAPYEWDTDTQAYFAAMLQQIDGASSGSSEPV